MQTTTNRPAIYTCAHKLPCHQVKMTFPETSAGLLSCLIDDHIQILSAVQLRLYLVHKQLYVKILPVPACWVIDGCVLSSCCASFFFFYMVCCLTLKKTKLALYEWTGDLLMPMPRRAHQTRRRFITPVGNQTVPGENFRSGLLQLVIQAHKEKLETATV